MIHRIERRFALVGLVALTEPKLNRRPLEDHHSASLVVMHPFLELARADQVANSLLLIWDQQSELFNREIFARRFALAGALVVCSGLELRHRPREFAERALQTFESQRIHDNLSDSRLRGKNYAARMLAIRSVKRDPRATL